MRNINLNFGRGPVGVAYLRRLAMDYAEAVIHARMDVTALMWNAPWLNKTGGPAMWHEGALLVELELGAILGEFAPLPDVPEIKWAMQAPMIAFPTPYPKYSGARVNTVVNQWADDYLFNAGVKDTR